MNGLVRQDLAHFVGPTSDFAAQEILRFGGSVSDLRFALDFVDSAHADDLRAYQALSPRMRRLVDLVTAAGPNVSRGLCNSADPMCNAIRGSATGSSV